MPHSRSDWFSRIKAVELEYAAVRQAVGPFLAKAKADPTILQGGVRVRDAQTALNQLESTYIVRIFAVFESGLRSFWTTRKRSNPKTRDLLNSIAGMKEVPELVLGDVHRVRMYRNDLVHEGGEVEEPVSIGTARSWLCRYFDRLPVQW